MSPGDVLTWCAIALVVVAVGGVISAVVAGVLEALQVNAACRRFHPGEPCQPGRNHPGAA